MISVRAYTRNILNNHQSYAWSKFHNLSVDDNTNPEYNQIIALDSKKFSWISEFWCLPISFSFYSLQHVYIIIMISIINHTYTIYLDHTD